MKDAYYFPHDCNARHDPALITICHEFGHLGYAAFFITLEMLREQNEYKLPIKFKPALFMAWSLCSEIKSRSLQGSLEGLQGAFQGLWEAFKSLQLFQEDSEYIWSDNLLKRMKYFDESKAIQRESGRRGGLVSQEKRRSLQGAFKEPSRVAQASKVNESKQINTYAEQTRLVFEYFCLKLTKKIVLSPERDKIISQRLKEGRTVEEMKTAIDNFSKDEWEDRHKFCDIIYCLGTRNKVNNLDKWLSNIKEDKKWEI